MSRSAALVAAAVVVSSVAWAVRLALDPEPFGSGPAAVVAIGGIALALVSATGVLVARGRWSRALGLALVLLWLGLSVAMTLDALGALTLAVTAGALVGLAGPWLGSWLRHLPSADGPDPYVTTVVLAVVGLPILTALALPDGIPGAGWAFIGVAVFGGWLLSQATLTGLWLVRISLPLAALWVLVAADTPGSVIVMAAGLAASGAAWRRSVRLAVDPLIPPAVERTPFPPELVPPDILEAAGYDDRGSPIEDGS